MIVNDIKTFGKAMDAYFKQHPEEVPTHLIPQRQTASKRNEKKPCLDCGTQIGAVSTRCRPCASQYRKAQRAERYI